MPIFNLEYGGQPQQRPTHPVVRVQRPLPAISDLFVTCLSILMGFREYDRPTCITPPLNTHTHTHNIRHMILYMIKLINVAKFVVDSLVKCIHFRIFIIIFTR